jgi:hypothetical protein
MYVIMMLIIIGANTEPMVFKAMIAIKTIANIAKASGSEKYLLHQLDNMVRMLILTDYLIKFIIMVPCETIRVKNVIRTSRKTLYIKRCFLHYLILSCAAAPSQTSKLLQQPKHSNLPHCHT